MKIKTPFQFTIFASILCAFFMTLCVFLIFEKLYRYNINLSIYLLLFFFVAVVVSVIIYLLLESFINQKIRLLYRMVQNYKMTNSDHNINMREDNAKSSTPLIQCDSKDRPITQLFKRESRLRYQCRRSYMKP